MHRCFLALLVGLATLAAAPGGSLRLVAQTDAAFAAMRVHLTSFARRCLAPLVLALAILIGPPQSGAQDRPSVTAKYGFSALFPKPPKETTEKDDKAVYHYFQLFDDHVLYQVAYSEAFEPLAASELVDAVNAVAKSSEGRVLSSEPIQFDFGGRRLAAREFSVENKRFVMSGKFMIDGKQLYGIMVATERGFDRQVAADRFMQSIKPVARPQR